MLCRAPSPPDSKYVNNADVGTCKVYIYICTTNISPTLGFASSTEHPCWLPYWLLKPQNHPEDLPDIKHFDLPEIEHMVPWGDV